MELEWLNQVVQAQPAEVKITWRLLLEGLAGGFGMGCVAAAVYYITSRKGDREADRSFLATLVLLSVLVALVTLVIGSSIASAFSLGAALTIIRFRTVVDDTRDTAFVIYAVIAGMAAGKGFVIGPLVATPLVFLGAWWFRSIPAKPVVKEGIVLLRLGAGRQPDAQIEAALKQHFSAYRLTALTTARGGSALDATYRIPLPAPENVFALVTELSRIEGVQGVEVKEG